MRRKVIQHGSSTLTISLPLKWARNFNIQKGDELIVEEQGRELSIRTEKRTNEGKKEIDIGSFKRLGVSYITSLYRCGYDEIVLKYDDPEYINKVQDVLLNELKGFEVINQTRNSCTIKDLLEVEKEKFDTALRRLWYLVLSLADDSLEAVKNDDKILIKNISKRDKSINRFSNYCERIIIKERCSSTKECVLHYSLIRSLEEIADEYKDLTDYYLHQKKPLSKEVIAVFSKVNAHLRTFHELFYRFDKKRTENLFSETKKIFHDVESMDLKKSDITIIGYLLRICNQTRNHLSTLIGLNL